MSIIYEGRISVCREWWGNSGCKTPNTVEIFIGHHRKQSRAGKREAASKYMNATGEQRLKPCSADFTDFRHW